MTNRIYNFSAGPAVLPEPALKKSAAAVLDFGGSGIGVLECSHRSKEFLAVIQSAEKRIREIAGVPEDYAVLFLQGGASLQFSMVPMNFLPADGTADYIDSGAWSEKAIKEAKRVGKVHVAGSSAADNYTYIPTKIEYSANPAYVHFTSNNTIFGTEWKSEPNIPASTFLVCDASSDILSRPLPVKKYGIIYAGAQKNLGPSGVTVVIMRKELVERGPKNLATMLQYRTHAENESMYNTPPTFGIFVLNEVLGWLQGLGGLPAIEAYNQEKAKILYDYLDESKMFRGTCQKESRSLMNVCFRARTEELENAFIKESEARGLSGLKGHRSVGGMRASIYNAFPKEGVQALVACMKQFEAANG